MTTNKKVKPRAKKTKKLGLYPEQIRFSTVFAGPHGLHACQNGIIRSIAELKRAFPAFPFASDVDLKQYDIIYVATGLHRTTGLKVEIYDVLYVTDRGGGVPPLIEVSYREYPPPSPTHDQVSYPMHIIKLQKLEGEVVFHNTTDVKR